MKDKGPGPLLFKPAPKWQVLSAIGGALLVHGIAVALAFHKEPPPVDTSDIPTATIEATLDQPPADAPPPPEIQPEFHEEQTPPPQKNKQKAQPIKAPQVVGPPKPPGMMTASQAKADRPPEEDRKSTR